MELLRALFPVSYKSKDVAGLIISILIYLVAGAVLGGVLGFLGKLWLVGWLFGIIGSLVGIYCTAGIVISVLVFLNILK